MRLSGWWFNRLCAVVVIPLLWWFSTQYAVFDCPRSMVMRTCQDIPDQYRGQNIAACERVWLYYYYDWFKIELCLPYKCNIVCL